MNDFIQELVSYQHQILFISKRGEVAAGEEAVDVGLGVPVFITVAGIAEETVVTEAFQVAVFDAEEGHEGFVVVDSRAGFVGTKMGVEFGEFVIDGLQ